MSEEERAQKLASLSENRRAAPKAAADDIKERNRIALEKRKVQAAAVAQSKASEKDKPLPAGWRRVESRSRPGEFVYENIHTEERQAWFPDTAAAEDVAPPLVAQSETDRRKEELKAKNLAALAKRNAVKQEQKVAEATLELPAGWTRTESRSRPGEVVYENTVTGERQAWFPTESAISAEDKKKAELAEKNKKALASFKSKQQSSKDEESKKPLPEGWRRVESRSRPGDFVYENIFSEERQAWFPDGPAEKPLPEGWRKVESRTYPGEFVYENIHTLDRQAWRPDEAPPAAAAAPAKAGALPAKKFVCKARALYDYTAENREEEIDLMEGDIIAVEYKAANNWWVGINTRTEKNGIFPGTYVEEIS